MKDNVEVVMLGGRTHLKIIYYTSNERSPQH
jgi:hypothetical protein